MTSPVTRTLSSSSIRRVNVEPKNLNSAQNRDRGGAAIEISVCDTMERLREQWGILLNI
jgi:hypothetical protein